MRSYRKTSASLAGYTLLEIMVALAVIVILATLTAPSFQDSLLRNSREAAMLELMSALALARSEAVTQSRTLTICRSLDQATCAGSSGDDWDSGWIIFTDSGVAGEVNANDTLVAVQGPGKQQTTIILQTSSNSNIAGDYLQFDTSGFLKSASTSYFRFCPSDTDVTNARAIWLSHTGRSTLSTDGGDGVHNDPGGNDLVCP